MSARRGSTKWCSVCSITKTTRRWRGKPFCAVCERAMKALERAQKRVKKRTYGY